MKIKVMDSLPKIDSNFAESNIMSEIGLQYQNPKLAHSNQHQGVEN